MRENKAAVETMESTTENEMAPSEGIIAGSIAGGFLWVLIIAVIAILFSGCSSVSYPRNEAEMFPRRNQDPTLGFIRFHGGAPTNLVLRDAAGRNFRIIGDRGSPYVTLNGQAMTRTIVMRLPIGGYSAENMPFYYALYVLDGRQLRELLRQNYSFQVSRSPSDCRDEATERYYGWCLEVWSGDVPQYRPGAIGVPRVDISGTGIIYDLLEMIRRR